MNEPTRNGLEVCAYRRGDTTARVLHLSLNSESAGRSATEELNLEALDSLGRYRLIQFEKGESFWEWMRIAHQSAK